MFFKRKIFINYINNYNFKHVLTVTQFVPQIGPRNETHGNGTSRT